MYEILWFLISNNYWSCSNNYLHKCHNCSTQYYSLWEKCPGCNEPNKSYTRMKVI